MQQNIQNMFQLFNPTSNKTGSKRDSSDTLQNRTLSNQNNCSRSRAQKFSSLEACNKDKSENLATVLHGVKDLKLENRPVPKINSNQVCVLEFRFQHEIVVHQVLLEIHVCGICGTDVHFYENGRLGPWTLKEPMIIGHEASGTVKECGE